MLNSVFIKRRGHDRRARRGAVWSPLRPIAMSIALAVGVIGCAEPPTPAAATVATAADPTPRKAAERPRSQQPPRPRPAARGPAKAAPAAGAVQPATPAQPSAGLAERPERGGDPARLVGQDETRIRALLGPAAEEVDVAPGKVWRYRDPRCTLEVSLYPDVQARVFRTLAYEVTSHDHTDEGRRLCLAELQLRANAAGSR